MLTNISAFLVPNKTWLSNLKAENDYNLPQVLKPSQKLLVAPAFAESIKFNFGLLVQPVTNNKLAV